MQVMDVTTALDTSYKAFKATCPVLQEQRRGPGPTAIAPDTERLTDSPEFMIGNNGSSSGSRSLCESYLKVISHTCREFTFSNRTFCAGPHVID
ncbi:Hypothetical predicted protein, partial [Scomber scombrus]